MDNIPYRVYYGCMVGTGNNFAELIKAERKRTGLTQADLAARAGVGLRFVRDLEQGKASLRLDTLNQVLRLFGYAAGPVRLEHDHAQT